MSTCGASKPGGGTCQNKTSGGRCWRHKNVPMGEVAKATKPKTTKPKATKPKTTKAAKPKSAKAAKPKSAKAAKSSSKNTMKFVEGHLLVGECVKNGIVVGIYFGQMVRETKTGIRVTLFGQKKENLTKYGDSTVVAVKPANNVVGDALIKKDGTWGRYPECRFKRVSKEEFEDVWEYEV